ncbi:putative alpha-L-rhamnosidase C [Aspergillus undulatus]|uniref:putative alpha-L-rhamnosidase C n=1 Tax=Aspergillus undulatus TaxID=1810928 RepID=UPI003CCDB8E0
MLRIWPALGLVFVYCVGFGKSEILVYPERFGHSSGGFHSYNANATCITLSPSQPNVTLDYGAEVGGYPFLYIHSLSGTVQIEAKYSEAKPGLDVPYADGPWAFQNQLSNTFRVETFNITTPGQIKSYFQQGGQRWQSLRLLNHDRNVRICGAGIQSLNERRPVNELPGYFESSNPLYNEIWALGARTVQQACIEKGTAPSTWEVTADGVRLRGQQSAQSALGADFSNYTMTFKTKIVRGGTGWRVATSATSFGPTFLLTSEYPPDATFLNTNRTLVPSNTLAVGFGHNIVNNTSLESGRVSYYELPFNVKEGQWFSISTSIAEDGYIVSIGSNPPITVPLSDLQLVSNAMFSTGSVYTGTWGFGPWADQVAYVKDVTVHAQNGTVLYRNPMTNETVLEEYGVMDNTESVCLDGAKRDRLVWSGDFAHTQRIISASTYRADFLKGTLKFCLERQETNGPSAGLFAMSPGMGQAAKYTPHAQYYLDFADEDFVVGWWAKIKTGVEVLLPLVDQHSGLATGGTIGAFFQGDSNGTAASALLTHTLNRLANLADVVGEAETAQKWSDVATNISDAVNRHLWKSDLGTYSSSLTATNETSYIGTTWAILSGTANETQAASAIAALSSLKLGIGYKLSSDLPASDPSTNLSPNLSGFLLEALFAYARQAPTDPAVTEAVDLLLNGLWAAMVDQDEYYTGTAWEYVYPDGRPGLDLFTSHAHPWGGAPTYVFTEYVLGIQPTKPGFKEWAFRPTLTHTGLRWAKGRVPTPHGVINASWKIDGSGKEVAFKVCGARNTQGSFSITLPAVSCRINGEVLHNGCDESGVRVDVGGTHCTTIAVSLAVAIMGLD